MDERELDRLQTEYLGRLRRQLRGVPPIIRDDAVREVQAHIDDGCRERGGDLHTILERLGPPEAYGPDLALQLMMQTALRQRSLPMLAWAALFWATTSLVGALAASGAALLYGVGIVFVLDGLLRLLGLHVGVVQANGVSYPPAWPPIVNLALGVGVGAMVTALLLRMLNAWGRSRLAARGMAVVLHESALILAPGWERGATLATALIATLGLASCSIFGALGGLYPLGHSGNMSLPQDFLKNPLTALALLGVLVFLLSPALGMWWAARRNET